MHRMDSKVINNACKYKPHFNITKMILYYLNTQVQISELICSDK